MLNCVTDRGSKVSSTNIHGIADNYLKENYPKEIYPKDICLKSICMAEICLRIY